MALEAGTVDGWEHRDQKDSEFILIALENMILRGCRRFATYDGGYQLCFIS